MKGGIVINVVIRCLIAFSLLAGGGAPAMAMSGAPAMAMNGSPDCMRLMQSQARQAPQKEASLPKLCPFADICAVAGYCLSPVALRFEMVRYAVNLSADIVDDAFHDLLAASPPLRPPRS